MRVRAYAKERRQCFQSELYAVLFSGVFEQCLVVQDGFLRLLNRYEQNADGRYETHVSYIDPDYPSDWIFLSNGDVTDFPEFPRRPEGGTYSAFMGYPWVWERRETLRRLLDGAPVPLADAEFPPVSSLLPGWNYVATPQGADALLKQARGFHDSVLVCLSYTSGAHLNPDNSMAASDRIRQVRMLFHSQQCPPLEMVFEGVKGLNLRPSGSDACSVLFEATLRVRNAAVFFCDGYCKEEQDYEGTKISAYSLRWRFLEPIVPGGTAASDDRYNIT